ncbi:ABC transporter substrate-binding protein [Litchfieldia salsa]|uniref:Carbohydrate ABC transporter substrate-binding protein, CUT1 family n=1 Tax=Litchfieldia salsa TaxID=930152 RepID=A0A1H0WRD7_9BACI|nr:ABC transporter substrate-binding protein [Litchfieldia salsa]SDP93274.1 carbohydrate ABC transporter substrate-binding protein, CUT1 family [Litchfieldia salsa]
MFENKKKWVSSLLFLMVSLVLFLSACSSDESSKIEGNSKGGEPKETAGFNEEGLPIVDEKMKLTFVSPKAPLSPNYSEMEIFKSLQDMTNVEIEWNNIPDQGYEEKKNLMLASGDLPDAFYSAKFTDLDIVKYGENGTLVPLEDLIDQYAPNIKALFEKRPELKSMVTAPDGHIYTLPRAEEAGLGAVPNFTSINKAWLDKLGLEMPTTMDELHDVLVAFKEQDPNGNGKQDEIPLGFMFNFWTGNFGDMFAAFNMPDNIDHRIVRNGQVIYTAVQPEYKEAIDYFHQWVKEGLIDPEAFTQDVSQYFAKGKSERYGSYIWWESQEVVGAELADDYVLLSPVEGPNGHTIVGRSNYSDYSRAEFAITSANEHPEVTMRWVDQLYAPKMSAQINWGPIGTIFEEENGMLKIKEQPEDVVMGELRQKVAPNGPLAVLKEDFENVVEMEPRAKQRLADLHEVYGPYLEEENYPQIFFSPEELEEINQLEVDIKEFVNQRKAYWMMEGGVNKEWDSYVDTLEQMGLNRLMEIYQNGLDRFNENK